MILWTWKIYAALSRPPWRFLFFSMCLLKQKKLFGILQAFDSMWIRPFSFILRPGSHISPFLLLFGWMEPLQEKEMWKFRFFSYSFVPPSSIYFFSSLGYHERTGKKIVVHDRRKRDRFSTMSHPIELIQLHVFLFPEPPFSRYIFLSSEWIFILRNGAILKLNFGFLERKKSTF